MKLSPALALLLSCVAININAQDDNQSDLRINPLIEASDSASLEIIEYPSYINLSSNHIHLNGDDWSGLVHNIKRADSARVSLVHIGDSHLQADMGTAITRNRLGERYGSAGRALIIPFRLAGTNEPRDYVIKSDAPMLKSRLLKTPWPTEMGFTGISIKPETEDFELSLSSKEEFDSIEIFYSGKDLTLCDSSLYAIPSPKSLKIGLNEAALDATLHLHSPSPVVIHGFNLTKGNSGISYHVIGNNGATYGTYNSISGFSTDIAYLSPALIIVSLGTNESFGKTSDTDMRTQMHSLISNLRQSCPDAKLLLTTPAECQRRQFRRRGKGRKRRRSAYYSVNTNIKRMRDVIMDFGIKEQIPVYDFYEVAGGDGSSTKWLSDNLLSKDRVHLTQTGYAVQGNLFTDALEEILNSSSK